MTRLSEPVGSVRQEAARALARLSLLAGGLALSAFRAGGRPRRSSELGFGSRSPGTVGAALSTEATQRRHLKPRASAALAGRQRLRCAGSLGYISRIGFAVAAAGGAVALLAAPGRRPALRGFGRWLSSVGLFGLLETWPVPPQLLVAQIEGGSYRWLEKSLLQTTAPMRGIYCQARHTTVATYVEQGGY